VENTFNYFFARKSVIAYFDLPRHHLRHRRQVVDEDDPLWVVPRVLLMLMLLMHLMHLRTSTMMMMIWM
jgi:hypothetical protein